MSIAIALHVLSAVIWVGGMFFAYMAERPAASKLPLEERLRLWVHTFNCFFVWVWAAVILLLLTGYGMVFAYFGGMKHLGLHIHLMQGLGILMMLIFLHVYFAPYRRLRRAVEAEDWEAGNRALTQIRKLVAVNTTLGLLVVAIASGGRYL